MGVRCLSRPDHESQSKMVEFWCLSRPDDVQSHIEDCKSVWCGFSSKMVEVFCGAPGARDDERIQ